MPNNCYHFRVYTFFIFFQRIKFKLGFDRKKIILNYAKSRKVKRILEIGVFNGHFAERLLREAVKASPNEKIHYTGVDLFAEGLTKELHLSEVSLFPNSLLDVKNRLSKINNAHIELIQGYSSDILPLLVGKSFDVIHIDGGHSYGTVKQDWLNSLKLLDKNTAVFFDDFTNRRGIIYGGFGVNNVVNEIDKKTFKIRFSKNRDFFWKPYGLLILRVVLVTLRKY